MSATYEKAVQILRSNLTEEEFWSLYTEMDEESGNAFFWVLAEAAKEMRPGEFVVPNEDIDGKVG